MVEKILNVLLVTSAGSAGCRCWLDPTARSGCAPPRTRPGPDTRPSAATCCTAPGRGTRARGRGARETSEPWCGRSARTETAASSGTRFSARTCLGKKRNPQNSTNLTNKSYHGQTDNVPRSRSCRSPGGSCRAESCTAARWCWSSDRTGCSSAWPGHSPRPPPSLSAARARLTQSCFGIFLNHNSMNLPWAYWQIEPNSHWPVDM